jgi:hypothetical protein
MITPTVADISQVAKIRWMTQAVENLATQVYLNSTNRAVIDQITLALAGAFEQIAGYGNYQTARVAALAGGICAPGWCSDGTACYPCDSGSSLLFPHLVSAAPPPPEPDPLEARARHGSQPKPPRGANPKA